MREIGSLFNKKKYGIYFKIFEKSQNLFKILKNLFKNNSIFNNSNIYEIFLNVKTSILMNTKMLNNIPLSNLLPPRPVQNVDGGVYPHPLPLQTLQTQLLVVLLVRVLVLFLLDKTNFHLQLLMIIHNQKSPPPLYN